MGGNYTIEWVGGHNGHWEIYNGKEFLASCDDGELKEVLYELALADSITRKE